jgi:tritrans,polycis-undecaprenyl-diphosphate synthase [geranylgeranyl-diphosphate specific]
MKMSKERIHMGVIMDGNRRYAKRLMMDPWKGHEYGADALEKVLEWSKINEIKEVTIYAFSIQNFNRPKHEFDYLMNIFRKQFDRMENDPENRVHKNKIKIKILGRVDLFPQDIQESCRSVQEKTKNHDGYQLNICFGYGGREEIVDAVHEIAKDVKEGKILPAQVDEELIDKYVYNSSQPDFIIRTGGDHRTSNFLLWQSAYSEWFFIDKFFPELTEEDLDQIYKEFQDRDRRFGK